MTKVSLQTTMPPSPVVHTNVNGAGVTGASSGSMTNEVGKKLCGLVFLKFESHFCFVGMRYTRSVG